MVILIFNSLYDDGNYVYQTLQSYVTKIAQFFAHRICVRTYFNSKKE
jgi:hypothetical protein